MTVLIYVAAWLGLAAIAVLNMLTREKVYGNVMPPIRARQLSIIIDFCLSGPYVWLLTSVAPIISGWLALLIAAIWFMVAIIIESLDLLAADRFRYHSLRPYDLFSAKLWPLMLLWAWVLHF